jgi:hypothetical protein
VHIAEIVHLIMKGCKEAELLHAVNRLGPTSVDVGGFLTDSDGADASDVTGGVRG